MLITDSHWRVVNNNCSTYSLSFNSDPFSSFYTAFLMFDGI